MRILITGGTGTLGKELLRQLDAKQIFVISRDELKQQNLRKEYSDVKFILGDIRDYDAMRHNICTIRPDIIFHAAALKHVDKVQENVREGLLTNTMGVINCHRAAQEAGVKVFSLSSTDKAVLPINAYGAQKLCAEEYLFSTSNQDLTNVVFRYGNVLGSRGSVIHSFANSLKNEGKVYITDHKMTRFWIPIEKAVRFMIERTMNVYNGQLDTYDLKRPLIPDLRALPVIEMARIVAQVLEITDFTVEEIGIRPGEKIHECLYSSHDHCVNSDNANQCDVDEIREYVKGVLND